MIDEGRKLISRFMGQSIADRHDFSLTEILEGSADYYAICPFLSEKFKARISMAGTVAYKPSDGTLLPVLASEFLEELGRLELEWGLR